MPKLKTHKATAKKVRITKGKKKKIIMKTSGQDHFNARESGTVGLNKKRNQQANKVDERNIRRQLPYS